MGSSLIELTPRDEASRSTVAGVARSYVAEARRRVGPKRDRIRPVLDRLAAEHPDAAIALRFRTDVELLISVMLSAQTTDVTVNRVTETLFVKYRRPRTTWPCRCRSSSATSSPTGTFRQKAKSLRGAMRMLVEEYDGEVPTPIDELVRLPGVGRKTANVVASERGDAAGDRRRHARAPALAAARAHPARGSGADRARPRAARAARGLGPVSRTSSSGTAGASATRGGRGARTASSSISARRRESPRPGQRPELLRGRERGGAVAHAQLEYLERLEVRRGESGGAVRPPGSRAPAPWRDDPPRSPRR